MRLEADTVERADEMVAKCGLGSTSLFFCDRRQPVARLNYLYHHGVSVEAQHGYEHGRIFEEDPFPKIVDRSDRSGRMIRWEERPVAALAGSAPNYRTFLEHHSVAVVGAFVQQVVPGLFLVLGAHCRVGSRWLTDLPERLLEHEMSSLAHMIVAQLIDAAFASEQGRHLIDDLLGSRIPGDPPTACGTLSRREREISGLVCAGKQNKQIAHSLGLSEFTVENHLRRIYRKLGVRNRAGMVTAVVRAPTVQ